MIHFSFNIGCSESKVIFSSDEKQKPHKSKRAFREANVCISFKQTQSNTFSSPEPRGLICNRPVAEPLVSLPRDQETTGSGDENVLFPARFAHTRYSSRMIDRFLNWRDRRSWKTEKRQDQRPLQAPAETDPYVASPVFFSYSNNIPKGF